MMMYWLLLSAGILGSLHCVGMCGPLALSLPAPDGASRFSIAAGRIIYHSGRIFSYMTIGLIFGAIGGAFVIAGWQQKLSIVAGGLLLVMALYKLSGLHRKLPIGTRFTTWITRQLAQVFNGKNRYPMFFAGMLNGYLPCGFVYYAAAMAVAIGAPVNSAVGMAFFGMGTFPVMFVMSMGTSFLSGRWRFKVNRYSMIFALMIGVLFVLRGMNLGVKYISPKVENNNHVECCEPENGVMN